MTADASANTFSFSSAVIDRRYIGRVPDIRVRTGV